MNWLGFSSNDEEKMTAVGTADERFAQVCEDLKLNVKLNSAETFLDVDNKEFTMYMIEVTCGAGSRAGATQWVLQRRYSQFNELKNRMSGMANYDKILSGSKFPGKIFFNKTSTKVVEERKVSLMEWINKLLASEFATNYHMNSFLEAVDDDVLHQGETLPSATWVDVEDKELKTDDIPKDQAVIIAAASYWTYQALTAFLDPACEATMKKYPTIKQYNVGLSELRLVPSAVRGQVKPVLAMIIKNANKKADEMAERCGAEKGANTLRFFPDFDGSFLKDLRVKDCDWTWRVWIVYNGEVMTNLRSSTPEAAQEFMNAYDAIASKAGIEAKA